VKRRPHPEPPRPSRPVRDRSGKLGVRCSARTLHLPGRLGRRWEWASACGLASVLRALLVGPEGAIGSEHRGSWVRVRLEGADTSRVEARGASLRFRMLSLRGDLCPVSVRVGVALSLPLCAAFEVGAVQAE
jgi:hypothetical protein